MARIPRRLRSEVFQRARYRCEYCQAQLSIVMDLEVDHIIPVSRGGSTTADNLCLACRSCNAYKLDFVSGLDPESGVEAALYNPRMQIWSEHFRWDKSRTRLSGMTVPGRATIARLHINRDNAVNARSRWIDAGWHPPPD